MRTAHRLSSAALVLVLLLAAVGAAQAATRPPRQADDGGPCANMDPGVQCGPGNNRQTIGGGEKVPHTGWPRVSGVLAKVLDSDDHDMVGGPQNDELLAHHGSDTVSGGAGHDVIW